MTINNTNIIICNNKPINTTITDWLSLYPGRFSIGKHNNLGSVTIYAYSDDENDISFLSDLAEKRNLKTYHSINMEGVTTIE